MRAIMEEFWIKGVNQGETRATWMDLGIKALQIRQMKCKGQKTAKEELGYLDKKEEVAKMCLERDWEMPPFSIDEICNFLDSWAT